MPDSIVLPKDSRLYIVDDKGVVFREANQRLYGLNTFATFMWCCLEEDPRLLQTEIKAKEVFDVDETAIKDWIAAAIEARFDCALYPSTPAGCLHCPGCNSRTLWL